MAGRRDQIRAIHAALPCVFSRAASQGRVYTRDLYRLFAAALYEVRVADDAKVPPMAAFWMHVPLRLRRKRPGRLLGRRMVLYEPHPSEPVTQQALEVLVAVGLAAKIPSDSEVWMTPAEVIDRLAGGFCVGGQQHPEY